MLYSSTRGGTAGEVCRARPVLYNYKYKKKRNISGNFRDIDANVKLLSFMTSHCLIYYICVHIYICTYIYMYICTYRYICIYIYTYEGCIVVREAVWPKRYTALRLDL